MNSETNEVFNRFLKEIGPYMPTYRTLTGTFLTFNINEKWIIYGASLIFEPKVLGKDGILYQGDDWRIVQYHWKPSQFDSTLSQAIQGFITIGDEKYATQGNDSKPRVSWDNPISADDNDPPLGMACKWYGLNINSMESDIFQANNEFNYEFEKKIAIGEYPFYTSGELIKILFPGLRYYHISNHHNPFIHIKAPTLSRFIKPNCQMRDGKATFYLEYNSKLKKSKFRLAVIQKIPKSGVIKRYKKRLPGGSNLSRSQGTTTIKWTEDGFSDTLYLQLMLIYEGDVVDKLELFHLDFKPINPAFRYYELIDENSQFLKDGFKGKGKKKGFETKKQQWAIKQLFTLIGFTCIDYGQDSMLQRSDMHEIDVIAYDFFNQNILAIEVTADNASVPSHREKLKERIAYLKEASPGFTIQPVIITAEEKNPSTTELYKLASYKIAIINHKTLQTFVSWAKQGGGLLWYFEQIQDLIPAEKPRTYHR